MPDRRKSLLSRLWFWLTLVLVAAICFALSIKGVRYTLWHVKRSDPDYDALDEQRSAEPVAKAAGTGASAEVAPTWTQYRGPHGTGVYDEGPLALDVPDGGPPLLWRAAVGPAYSSVVVARGLVITMEQYREEEALLAFGEDSGELVWKHTWPARFYDMLSKEGPRATPAIAGERVISLGATGELRCVALATGELLWRRDLLEGGTYENLYYGTSASPRLLGDVVFAMGPSSVSAFDVATGEPRWSALSEQMAYATPQLGELLGQTTLVVETAVRVVGLDPATGRELWSFPWEVSNGLSITQPILLAPDRVLVSAGYGKGAQLMRLVPAENGEDSVTSEVVWRSARLKTRFNEPVLVGEHVYGLDEGTLVCLAVRDGRRAWKEGDYGYGQLLTAGEHLLVVDEDGGVHVLTADPEGPTELGSFDGLDGGVTLNVPALAHGRLYLRSEKELVVYDLRVPASN